MVIRTNTPKLHHHRKMILELLLASHCRDCTICEKNQKCQLQALARGSAFTISVLRTTGPIMRSMTPLPPLSGI